jgi:hypothetical protein
MNPSPGPPLAFPIPRLTAEGLDQTHGAIRPARSAEYMDMPRPFGSGDPREPYDAWLSPSRESTMARIPPGSLQ